MEAPRQPFHSVFELMPRMRVASVQHYVVVTSLHLSRSLIAITR